uniref:Uncharacterized protein n=1 Tax=Mycena chlorophos TaxID=658473 RepID=A0ABQ0KW48_MYCCL|nr:predicted protein [Mycena chlorophos]
MSQASVLLMVPTNTPSTSTTGGGYPKPRGAADQHVVGRPVALHRVHSRRQRIRPSMPAGRPAAVPRSLPARRRHVHYVRDGRNKLGVCVARGTHRAQSPRDVDNAALHAHPSCQLEKARLLRLGDRVAGARRRAGCIGGAGKKVVPASATEVEQTKKPVRPRRASVRFDSTAMLGDTQSERRSEGKTTAISHSHTTGTPVLEAERMVRLPDNPVVDSAAEEVESKQDGMALCRTRRSSGVYPLSAMKQTPVDGSGDALVLDVEGEGGEHATPTVPACNTKQDDEGGERKDAARVGTTQSVKEISERAGLGEDGPSENKVDGVPACKGSGFLHGKGSRLVQKVKEKMHLGSGAGMVSK